MTKNDLIKIGFKEVPHFTVTGTLTYDIGRNRFLNIGCLGTPNEMLFICSKNGDEVTDIITLHNWDYDGYITMTEIQDFIKVLSKKDKIYDKRKDTT